MGTAIFKIRVNGKLKHVKFNWNCEKEDWDGVIKEIFNTDEYEYLGDDKSWKGGIDFELNTSSKRYS